MKFSSSKKIWSVIVEGLADALVEAGHAVVADIKTSKDQTNEKEYDVTNDDEETTKDGEETTKDGEETNENATTADGDDDEEKKGS